ncbi:MAG: hypothetical protein HY289_03885, partial [Planctomycetes bacterium]|nr:hypothetical protein [Planctomycetota bacterium]
LAFSPDGRQLACAVINSAAGRGRSSIFVVEMASKKVRLEWAAHPDALIECLAYSPDSGLLASGATDTTVLVWRAGLREYASRPRNDATEEEVAGWFKQMGGADAKAAYQHMIKLVQTPKQAVKLFAARIAPATQPDLGGKTIGQWVADLGSGQFAVRTEATAMLQKLGLSAAPALRAALSTARDVEMKRRIEEMLDRVAAPEWSAEDVLHARAVEVLEALADAESRALLTRWSAGHGPAVLTSEARKALANLDRNAKKSG